MKEIASQIMTKRKENPRMINKDSNKHQIVGWIAAGISTTIATVNGSKNLSDLMSDANSNHRGFWFDSRPTPSK